MEAYLPIIQTTLAEWLQLTIDHPLYAAALVIGVWLLTAILYSIKIAGLNKKNRLSEQARTGAEANLNTAQQQLQQVQDELAATTEQLGQQQELVETEKQRTSTAELQLAQRNQDIATTIQSLASSFDIGERPLTVPANLKADDLWQQHDKVIKQLIERLRNEQQAKMELEKFYQAEKTKLAETEAQLVSLQTNLDSQTSLVLALQTQTTALQQQQNDTQRDLTEVLKKHQADLARLLQLEQQASQFTHTQPHLDVAPITPAPAPVQTAKVEQVTAAIEEPAPSPAVAVNETTTNMQDLFKKSQPSSAPATTEDEITTIQPEVVSVAPVMESEPLAIVEPVAVAETPEKTSKVSALKGMYQKFTTSKTEQPEPVPAVSVIESEPVAIKVEAIEEMPEKTSKVSALKGMYQKFTTSKTEQPEPAPVVSVVEPKPEPELAPIMQVVEPEPAPVAPAPVSKVDTVAEIPEKPGNIGQLKGLYQKYTTAKVKEKELAPESFDNASSSLEDAADKITEKLEKMKGLYGKFFSKKDNE